MTQARIIPFDETRETEALYVRHGPFIFTPNGMAPPENGAVPPIEQWGAAGGQVAIVARSPAFIVGDWVRFGEERYGELAAQYIDVGQWSKISLDIYRKLSERVPPSVRRMDRLGTRHHLLVQKRSVAEQRRWLGLAANEAGVPWTVNELRDWMRDGLEPVAVAWAVTVAFKDALTHAAFVRQMQQEGREPASRIRYQYREPESA